MSEGGARIPGEHHGGQTGALSFEHWRVTFFADAESHGLLPHAEAIGDYTLRMFWKEGTAPSVQGVLGSADGLASPKADSVKHCGVATAPDA